MISSEDTPKRPRVLLVYYTYTQQSKLVAEAMAEALRARGCEVSLAPLGFTDKRWSERFARHPLRHAWLEVFSMLPAQLRGATGEIEIPHAARQGDYDLVCIGGPTWFFRQSVSIRSFLRSDEAARLLDGTRFITLVVLPPLLEAEPEVRAQGGGQARRRVGRWHALHVRRRPDPVVPVAGQLPRRRGDGWSTGDWKLLPKRC